MLESYLLLNGKTALQVGAYKIELREGELSVTRLPPQGWEQLKMNGLGREQAPSDDGK